MTAGDHHPPSNHQPVPPTSRGYRPRPIEWFIIFSSSLVFTASFVALLLFLFPFEQPKIKKPQFELQQIGVEYLNYSVNAPTTASVSLAIRMLLMAKNDNDFAIDYGLSSFKITYRGVPLGWATLPGFRLDYYCEKWVQTTVTADRVNMHSADFVRDASLNDRVELRVMGDVNVTMVFVVSGWGTTSTKTTTASVDCVIAISPRKQALTSKLCASDILKV